MRVESRCRSFRRNVLICLMFLGIPSLALAAGTPLQLIQSGTDRALEILRSSRSGTSPTIRERRDEILVIVDEYFDFHEMSKRALGRSWKDQSPQKQREFVKLFKQLLFNTYVDRVEKYTGSNERVLYDSEDIDGDYALVKTRVEGYMDKDVRVDYRLHLDNGEWKVYDVVVEGISLVNNYRQQFASILTNEPFDYLLNRIQEKLTTHRYD